MKISVVTPSYNQAEFIERTIKSVIDQDYPDIEYIIMDGGSTDGTVEILKKYSDKIIWKSEKDNGQSDGINKGLKMTTGDIVTYLNSDDTYEPGALKKVAKFFENNPEKKWVYGKCKIINENDAEIRKSITWYKNFLLKKYSHSKLLRENFVSQPATFWKRELLSEIGYFNEDEHFCMDYEYWLRIGQKYPAGVIPEYLANFRYYADSKSGSVNKKQFRDELRLARKYGKDYYFSLLVHKINYYKITGIYQAFNFKKNFSGKTQVFIKIIYRNFRFLYKLILNKEVYFKIQKKIPKQFIGSEKYGGWYIHPNDLNSESIVYSFGIGEDISFDLDLIHRFGCKIYAFDPTPKSINWLKRQKLPAEFSYFEYGIAGYDGTAKFFPPQNPSHVSHTIVAKRKNTDIPIEVPVHRLETILKKFNDKKIDLLKMDVEGAEYEVLGDILVENDIEINQILVEFHHRFPEISSQMTKDAIKKLNIFGYKIFAISPSREEYSFIKTTK